jgi:serine/threonine protein kinase
MPYSSTDEMFERETIMLNALRRLDHRHIIKLLGSYRLQNQYHMIFPFAKSNLRQFWVDNHSPVHSREKTLWALRQIKGLAEGIENIHLFHLEEGGEDFFGRHGDLKPENILLFEKVEGYSCEAGSYGTLQIADFGFGVFQRRSSRSNVTSGGGTGTYQPPEAVMNKPITRAYDIWSFGCICFEFIVWLLYGPIGVEEFAIHRMRDSPFEMNDNFFTIRDDSSTSGRAEIQPAVARWIDKLKNHSRCKGALYDLLVLIENDLLSVDYLTGGRIKAGPLVKCLGQILEIAEANDGNNDYLFPEISPEISDVDQDRSPRRPLSQEVLPTIYVEDYCD